MLGENVLWHCEQKLDNTCRLGVLLKHVAAGHDAAAPAVERELTNNLFAFHDFVHQSWKAVAVDDGVATFQAPLTELALYCWQDFPVERVNKLLPLVNRLFGLFSLLLVGLGWLSHEQVELVRHADQGDVLNHWRGSFERLIQHDYIAVVHQNSTIAIMLPVQRHHDCHHCKEIPTIDGEVHRLLMSLEDP